MSRFKVSPVQLEANIASVPLPKNTTPTTGSPSSQANASGTDLGFIEEHHEPAETHLEPPPDTDPFLDTRKNETREETSPSTQQRRNTAPAPTQPSTGVDGVADGLEASKRDSVRSAVEDFSAFLNAEFSPSSHDSEFGKRTAVSFSQPLKPSTSQPLLPDVTPATATSAQTKATPNTRFVVKPLPPGTSSPARERSRTLLPQVVASGGQQNLQSQTPNSPKATQQQQTLPTTTATTTTTTTKAGRFLVKGVPANTTPGASTSVTPTPQPQPQPQAPTVTKIEPTGGSKPVDVPRADRFNSTNTPDGAIYEGRDRYAETWNDADLSTDGRSAPGSRSYHGGFGGQVLYPHTDSGSSLGSTIPPAPPSSYMSSSSFADGGIPLPSFGMMTRNPTSFLSPSVDSGLQPPSLLGSLNIKRDTSTPSIGQSSSFDSKMPSSVVYKRGRFEVKDYPPMSAAAQTAIPNPLSAGGSMSGVGVGARNDGETGGAGSAVSIFGGGSSTEAGNYLRLTSLGLGALGSGGFSQGFMGNPGSRRPTLPGLGLSGLAGTPSPAVELGSMMPGNFTDMGSRLESASIASPGIPEDAASMVPRDQVQMQMHTAPVGVPMYTQNFQPVAVPVNPLWGLYATGGVPVEQQQPQVAQISQISGISPGMAQPYGGPTLYQQLQQDEYLLQQGEAGEEWGASHRGDGYFTHGVLSSYPVSIAPTGAPRTVSEQEYMNGYYQAYPSGIPYMPPHYVDTPGGPMAVVAEHPSFGALVPPLHPNYGQAVPENQNGGALPPTAGYYDQHPAHPPPAHELVPLTEEALEQHALLTSQMGPNRTQLTDALLSGVGVGGVGQLGMGGMGGVGGAVGGGRGLGEESYGLSMGETHEVHTALETMSSATHHSELHPHDSMFFQPSDQQFLQGGAAHEPPPHPTHETIPEALYEGGAQTEISHQPVENYSAEVHMQPSVPPAQQQLHQPAAQYSDQNGGVQYYQPPPASQYQGEIPTGVQYFQPPAQYEGENSAGGAYFQPQMQFEDHRIDPATMQPGPVGDREAYVAGWAAGTAAAAAMVPGGQFAAQQVVPAAPGVPIIDPSPTFPMPLPNQNEVAPMQPIESHDQKPLAQSNAPVYHHDDTERWAETSLTSVTTIGAISQVPPPHSSNPTNEIAPSGENRPPSPNHPQAGVRTSKMHVQVNVTGGGGGGGKKKKHTPQDIDKKMDLVQKQNNNIARMVESLEQIHNPGGERSDPFDRLIENLVALRHRIIGVGLENEKMRKENALMRQMLKDRNIQPMTPIVPPLTLSSQPSAQPQASPQPPPTSVLSTVFSPVSVDATPPAPAPTPTTTATAGVNQPPPT